MKKVSFFMMLLAAIALMTTGCEPTPTPDGGNDDQTGQTPDGDDVIDPTPIKNFAFSVSDITGSCAKVEVKPNIANTYYFDIIERAEYEQYDDPKVLIEEIIADIEETILIYQEVFQEQVSLIDFLNEGKATWFCTCTLDPQTEYYVFAAGVSADGRVTTDVEVMPFKTIAPQPSLNTFTVSHEDAIITVTPSIANEYYMIGLYYTEELAGKSDSEIIEFVIADAKDSGIDFYIGGYGMNEFDYTGALEAGDDLTVCVFGYDGEATTGLTKHQFVYEGTGSGSGSDSGSGNGGENFGFTIGDSTLSGNLTLTATEVYCGDYGDYYGCGTRNFYFELYTTSSDCVFFECFSALSNKGVPTGVLPISSIEEIGKEGTVMPGCLDVDEYLLGSWWATLDNDGYVVDYAAAVSGELTIEKSGSGHNLLFSFKDMLNNEVKISYAGTIEVSDESEGYATFSAGARLYKSHSGKRLTRKQVAVAEHKCKMILPKNRKPRLKVSLR
ncbi:MAG: hypothetical protein IIV91_03505 [Alistipes sp.]|nr:hypothetical protein [Alistipes sp.]